MTVHFATIDCLINRFQEQRIGYLQVIFSDSANEKVVVIVRTEIVQVLL